LHGAKFDATANAIPGCLNALGFSMNAPIQDVDNRSEKDESSGDPVLGFHDG